MERGSVSRSGCALRSVFGMVGGLAEVRECCGSPVLRCNRATEGGQTRGPVGIRRPTTNNQRSTSNIQHRTLNLEQPTSNFEQATNIQGAHVNPGCFAASSAAKMRGAKWLGGRGKCWRRWGLGGQKRVLRTGQFAERTSFALSMPRM